jgi:hypothetical protein
MPKINDAHCPQCESEVYDATFLGFEDLTEEYIPDGAIVLLGEPIPTRTVKTKVYMLPNGETRHVWPDDEWWRIVEA